LRALILSIVALALAGASPAFAQTALFADDRPIAFTLTGPFPELVRAAPASIKPFPATLTLTEGASAPQSFSIEMRARGHTRRTDGFCRFPPILLRFDKKTVKGTLFDDQKKLKLVTYCRPESDYEQRIVLEYLAYRLDNLITPMSFKVRAAEVTYRSSETDKGVTRFGYLIEDIGDVAYRNDRDELTAPSHAISIAQLDPRASARAALFEYMIGNLDWDFLAALPNTDCCHNSRLIAARNAAPATATNVVPVPYDYDWSGLVDSPYAGPPPGFSIDRVTERVYRGYCASGPQMGAVIDEFRSHRDQMLALVDAEPHLDAAFRAKTERFLNGFFAVLDDPARVQREIIQHCRRQ
jgi:hypothetical protein